jgi:hypothetical protein
MKDITGRDLQIGDFIVYTDGGVNAPDLVFGWIRRLNENTDKIWVEHATWKRQPRMKKRYDRDAGKWIDTDVAYGVSIVNHTQDARFMVL